MTLLMPRTGTANQQGFTLIELVMTIVILGGLSLILIPIFQGITRGPDPVIRQRAIALGQAMMDEITAKKWDLNTPAGGGPICTGESDATRGSLAAADCTDPAWQATTPIAGTGTPGNRSDYTVVDNYHNHAETGNFWDQSGNAFTMSGYTRTVAVRYIASASDPIDHNTPAAAATTDTKLVVVTVTTPRNETLHLVSVLCNL